MKYNYPPLGGICGKCRGCNRLELDNFKGVWRCNNYIEKEKSKDEQNRDTIQTSKSKSIHK